MSFIDVEEFQNTMLKQKMPNRNEYIQYGSMSIKFLKRLNCIVL